MCAQVLENTSAGNFNARPLHFGQPLSDRVDKSGCHYYTLDLQQSHIDAGFVIGAHSSTGSKFKLLMFEQTDGSSGGQWELVVQEDSMKVSHSSVSPGHKLTRCVYIRSNT
jgi:hypothetical protein